MRIDSSPFSSSLSLSSPLSVSSLLSVFDESTKKKKTRLWLGGMIDRSEKETKQKSRVAVTHVDCCSVVWCSRGMCFAGRPGPCAPLASFLPWMIPDPGRCGYQDLVQPLATTNTCCFPRLMSNNDNLLSSITPPSPLPLSSSLLSFFFYPHKCTRATTWGCTRSLTECHDPRIVHHCGIGRNITCRQRFHIRLELVQTRTTTVAFCRLPLPNTLYDIYQTSTNCPAHIRC